MLELERVSVRFRVPVERVSTLQETVVRWLQRRMRYRDFWALRNVSVRIERGEAIGIIGRNGAGKSTLLRVMAGVIKPTVGTVSRNGRLVPLIDLTAGFDMELTGRENIYLQGAIFGLSAKEMNTRLEDVVAFAEIPEFIDAPLRMYSSGMIMRLGFAIATQMEPELLLVDEVLAVGDERFQQKCLRHFDTLRTNGVTVAIVSHSAELMKSLCSRAIWLEQGSPAREGPAEEVVEEYHKFMKGLRGA